MRALSRAHDLLSHSRWEGANLGRLIDEELEPYRTRDASRVTAEGPAVVLQPIVAQTLALALHELATNAAKYGALSKREGSLEDRMGPSAVIRSRSPGPRAVDRRSSSPVMQGFGTKLIDASIQGQLNGSVAFEWHSSGLSCRLVIPREEHAEKVSGQQPSGQSHRRQRDTWNRMRKRNAA